MNTTRQVWLTEYTYERLQQELDHLLGTPTAITGADLVPSDFDRAPVISADRRAARITQLQEILRHAVVGEPPPDDGMAEPGMVLTVRFHDTNETATFLLGLREHTESGGLEAYSPDSPLGAALCGARQGERRRYTVPNGKAVDVTLLHAVPYGRHLDIAIDDSTVDK